MTYEEIEQVLKDKTLNISFVRRGKSYFAARKIVKLKKSNYIQWGEREKRIRHWRVFIRLDKTIGDVFALNIEQEEAVELCEQGKTTLTASYGVVWHIKLT